MRLSISARFVAMSHGDDWVPDHLIKCGFDYMPGRGIWARDIDDEQLAIKTCMDLVKRGIRVTVSSVV